MLQKWLKSQVSFCGVIGQLFSGVEVSAIIVGIHSLELVSVCKSHKTSGIFQNLS